MNTQGSIDTPRRTFLRGAAVAAGAAALGFPNVVKAQGPISMRWQSTWPQKDIFHEYALDFAKKVNDRPVLTRETAREALAEASPERPLRLIVRREDERVPLTLEPAP